MEPEVRAYLIRILNTISMGALWLTINATAGLKFELAYFEKSITTGNILFYVWFVISLIALSWYLIRMWSKPLNIKM